MKDYLWGLSLAAVAVLSPVTPLLAVIGVLIFFDLVSGLWRAHKCNEKITSNGFRRTITKIVAYNMAVITCFLMEKYFFDSLLPLGKIIATFIGITEGKSILENLSKITGLDFRKHIISLLNGKKEKDK